MKSFYQLYEAISGFQGGYHQRFSDFWAIAEGYESAYRQLISYVEKTPEPNPQRFGMLIDAFLKKLTYFPWTYDYIVTNSDDEELKGQLRDATTELKHALEMYDHVLGVVKPVLKKMGESKKEAVSVFKKHADEASSAYETLETKMKEVMSQPGYKDLPRSQQSLTLQKNVEGRRDQERKAELERQSASMKKYRRYDALMSAKPDERLTAAVKNTSRLSWPNNATYSDIERYVLTVLKMANAVSTMKEFGTLGNADRTQVQQAMKSLEQAASAAKDAVDNGHSDRYTEDSAKRYYAVVQQNMQKLQQFLTSLPEVGGAYE